MVLLIQPKYSIKKTAAIISSTFFLIWVVNAIIYNFSDINFVNRVYPISVTLPAFLCFFWVSKPNIFKLLFSFLTVCNFGMLTSCVGFLNFTGIFAVRVLFECIAIVLIFTLVLKVFRKPYFKILNSLEKGWGLLCTFPLLLSAVIYLLLYYPTELNNRPESIPVVILVFVLMFVFYAVVYGNFENISQLYQFKHDREVILIQTEMQKKEYDAIMDKVNATQVYHHDMRHHINVIHAFLTDNNISEAENYLTKLNVNLSNIVVKQYCENYMLNVILSSYISKANDENIEVQCNAEISENIKIDNIELGLIFTNAIENAIIACKKIDTLSDRKITIACKEHYNQIYIQISNPFVGEVQFNGEYPVSNDKDHGIGTRSIATIAEKYDGIFSFKAEGSMFKTTVILNNK
jgi:hypothetical protein